MCLDLMEALGLFSDLCQEALVEEHFTVITSQKKVCCHYNALQG